MEFTRHCSDLRMQLTNITKENFLKTSEIKIFENYA